MKTAEEFYTGIGFPKLPQTFWTASDLYPVKPGEPRKKNTHASCWHVDLETDIRSLMSVEPNSEWFSNRSSRARPRLLLHGLHPTGGAATLAHRR